MNKDSSSGIGLSKNEGFRMLSFCHVTMIMDNYISCLTRYIIILCGRCFSALHRLSLKLKKFILRMEAFSNYCMVFCYEEYGMYIYMLALTQYHASYPVVMEREP